MLWKKAKWFWKSGFAAISFTLILSVSGCSDTPPEETQVDEAVMEASSEDEFRTIWHTPRLTEEELQPTTVTADYAEAFGTIHGCAVIFVSENNTYTFYNEEECRTRVSPNSTFKVISALIGLHHQVITTKDSKIGYDGLDYPINAWNADLSLEEAFSSSCIWYFRKLIDEVGQKTVQEELNTLHYGNCDISEWSGSEVNSYPELNGFWLESSLLIAPIEQVEILRNIVEGRTIYTKSEVELLKQIMLVETGISSKVYGKTGTGTDSTAWFIGFVEKEEGNIYFAIYLNDDTSSEINGAKAQEIALNILMGKG